MNTHSCKKTLFTVAFLLSLALEQSARADGAIGFLSFGGAGTPPPPTLSVITSGEPFSYMDRGKDWSGLNIDTHAGANGIVYATLNRDQIVVIQSWRTLTDLRMIFSIDDITKRQPNNATLLIGDKIIIQIDPNHSGGAGLQFTAG